MTIYLPRGDRKYVRPVLDNMPDDVALQYRLGDSGAWTDVPTVAGSPRILVRGPEYDGDNPNEGVLITEDVFVSLRVVDDPERISAVFDRIELI